MRNLANKDQKNFKELDKVINACSNLLKLWVFQVLFIIVAIALLVSQPEAAISIMLIGVILFFVANICLSLSLFFHGGEGDLVKRQRRILVAVWLIDIFLNFTIIGPIIVRCFFYKGYKELLNEEEIEHYERRTTKKKKSVLGIIFSILGILLITIVLLVILGAVIHNRMVQPPQL